MTFDLLSTDRHPIISCLILDQDGVTTFMDVSAWMIYAQTVHSDQLESHKLTLSFANVSGTAPGYFDIYQNTTAAQAFQVGMYVSLQVGFRADDGTETLYPIFYGRIAKSDWSYKRPESDVMAVVAFDLMYAPLTVLVTTNPFYNQALNLVASDLLQQYMQRTETNFYPVTYTVPFTQFPSMTLASAWADLFGLVNYGVWFDYQGRLASFPLLGTAATGSPSLIGWPDATAPPDSTLMAFSFPENCGIVEEIRPGNYVFTFANQVTVLGQALNETITYGPVQLLATLGNANTLNSVAKGKGATYNIALTEQSQGGNLQIATGVYASVFCPNFHNSSGGNAPGSPTNIKLMCSDPTAVTPDGVPVPLGPFESNGHDNDNNGVPGVIATDDNGNDMGMLFLNVPIDPGLSVWQNVPMGAYANSNNNGWTFYIDIYGRPIVSTDAVLTKILDYNPIALILTSATDIFGDHRTYQILDPQSNAVQPVAMGTPVEVYVNLSSLPSPTTLSAPATPVAITTPPTPQTITVTSAAGFTTPGSPPTIATMNIIVIDTGALKEYAVIQSIAGDVLTLEGPLEFSHSSGAEVSPATLVISADGVYISQLASIAWEQGQIIFYDMTYKDYGSDNPPPVILSLTSQPSGGIDLAWTADAHGATSYSLYRGLSSGGETLLVSGLTGATYNDTGLTNGTPYYYYITPYYGATAGAVSNEVEGIPDAPAFPNNQPTGYTSSGGTAKTVEEAGYPDGETFDLTYLTIPAPQEIFQTSRYTTTNATGDSFTYTIGGLQFGRGYTVILSYGDPTIVPANTIPPDAPNLPTSGAGFRVFNVVFNNGFIDTNFDTWVNANGNLIASTKTYEGITCDSGGVITIEFVNGTPPSGTPSGQYYGNAMISAIEIYDPQGIEAAGVVINCGGAAITPTPPTVNVTAAYSPNQRQYGIKNKQIDNPLLGTIAQCTENGQWLLNEQAWQRFPYYVRTACIPTIQPGQLIEVFNPIIGPNGGNQWQYVQQITRTIDRTDPKAGKMFDEYNCFLVYSQLVGGFTFQQLQSNPVALWPLNDCTGSTPTNLVVGSVYSAEYNPEGSLTSVPALCADQSAAMQTNYSSVPGIYTNAQPESLPQFSIEFLMLPPVDPAGFGSFGFYGGTISGSTLNGNGIRLTCTPSEAATGTPGYFAIGVDFTGGYVSLQTAAIPWATLSHVVLTWDGINLVAYLNGAVMASAIPSGTIISGASQLSLGSSGMAIDGFSSTIGVPGAQYNNLAVYNYPLSAGAIQTHYASIGITT